MTIASDIRRCAAALAAIQHELQGAALDLVRLIRGELHDIADLAEELEALATHTQATRRTAWRA